jgi:hypothetical protein
LNKSTSAVNLKFLSLLAASSFRNFKFKTALAQLESGHLA